MSAFLRDLARRWRPEPTADGQWDRLAAGLGDCEPVERARRLTAAAAPLLAATPGFEDKLRRLEQICTLAEPLLAAFEREIDAADPPLPPETLRRAIAADNLLKAVAAEYQGIVIRAASADGPPSHALKHSAWLAVRLLARRQWLACRAGKTASAASWRHLHRLHGLARDRGFATYGESGDSVESNYLAAVLLALADPASLARADLLAVLDTIRRLAPLARLVAAHDEAGRPAAGRPLVVGVHDQQPAFETGHGGAGATAWRIDLASPVARLQEEIRLAEESAPPAGDPAARRPRALLRLLERWRNQPVRRFSRQRMRPRVDVVTGIERLWWALSGPGVSRRRPVAGAGDEAAEWIIVDESADGFGLRLVAGGRPGLDVGDVIGVGMRDIGRLHLCVVRRIDDGPRLRCQVGVQQLGPEAHAVVLADPHGGRQTKAIRLPGLPAHGGRAGLLLEAGRVAGGTVVQPLDEGAPPLRIVRTVEDNGRHALCLVEPAPPGA